MLKQLHDHIQLYTHAHAQTMIKVYSNISIMLLLLSLE